MLTSYLEENDFFEGRPCEEHICTSTAILRNRICQKQNTFVAYLDENAFDKMNTIKPMNYTECCVHANHLLTEKLILKRE